MIIIIMRKIILSQKMSSNCKIPAGAIFIHSGRYSSVRNMFQFSSAEYCSEASFMRASKRGFVAMGSFWAARWWAC